MDETPSNPADSGAAQPPPVPAAAVRAAVNAGSRVADPTVTHDQRTYCLLMHASIILLHVLGPLSFLVPLVMWLTRKEAHPFIDDHGRETVNFHLTITLYGVVGFALLWAFCLGVPIVAAAYILALVGGIMACQAASRGEYFRYPMCIRFIR